MRTSFLLAIGLVFLGLALAGTIYLLIPQEQEELSSTTVNIPGGTLQSGGATEIPAVGEPSSTNTNTPIPSATGTPEPILTDTPSTSTPTNTPGAVTVTIPPSSCDKAELIADVNIPDGTILAPGAAFTKTWRLKNVGSCEWSPSYQLVFFSGEQMGAAASTGFTQNVPVGQTVDILVNMTAPSTAGSYRGYWIFKNASGQLFGIGPHANQPWWVDIRVSGPTITPGGPTVTPGGPTLTPIAPRPTSLVIDVPPQLVEAEWPIRLRVGQSGTIRISLIRASEGYEPTVEIQGNTAIASTPIPVGTLDVEPRYAFGPNYEAYALAHIAGAPFDISLASPESQSLDQTRVDWVWNITSEETGLQGVDVSVEIEWRPIDNSGELLTRQVWRSHLRIEVYKPLLSTGQVSVFSLVSGFLGSGLSIPWLYEMISKRKSQRRKKGSKRT